MVINCFSFQMSPCPFLAWDDVSLYCAISFFQGIAPTFTTPRNKLSGLKNSCHQFCLQKWEKFEVLQFEQKTVVLKL